MTAPANSLLLERAGLPDDLRWLVQKYPRENWQGHANIHGLANMWLSGTTCFANLAACLPTALPTIAKAG